MSTFKKLYTICVGILLLFTACSDDFQTEGPIGKILKNDCLKRSLGPNIEGNDIEFVYAMAIPPKEGKILSASVEASIAGAGETYLEHRSFHTNSSGVDVGIVVGSPCATTGGKTEVNFTVDTCAAALRYFYRIPNEARGKEITFKFSVKASNGETVSYNMGPYSICRMEMKRNITVSDGAKCYISIADMAVYNETEAAANASKIDLIYLYRSIPGISFGHAFVSPVTDPQYRPNVIIPPGVNNNTPIRKVSNLRDRHLADLQYGVYVDDPDLVTIDLTNMPNYAINMINELGMWVETQDKKYKAYIYINSINNSDGSAVISMKRLAMN
jgi:hypothetical protein